jgi:hypothetical protein
MEQKKKQKKKWENNFLSAIHGYYNHKEKPNLQETHFKSTYTPVKYTSTFLFEFSRFITPSLNTDIITEALEIKCV